MAVFLCRGSELTLRDCTVTIEGPAQRPLALVQAGGGEQGGGSGPTRVRLERTLARGPAVTAMRFAEGPARLELVDSALLLGAGPAIVAGGGPEAARSVAIVGGLLATSGPFLELAGSAEGPNVQPLDIRVSGASLACIESPEPSGLVAHRDAVGGPSPPPGPVVWRGDRNTFIGWPESASAGDGRVVIAGLTALRERFGQAEQHSASSVAPISRENFSSWLVGQDLLVSDARFAASVARVAVPSPNLRDWTFGSLPRLPDPPPEAFASAPKPPLEFDADDSEFAGDLGRFLAQTIPPGSRNIRVTVRGAGRKWMTPIDLREGVSLEIVAESTSGEAPLYWLPVDGAPAESLIRVRWGDLMLRGVRIERDARSQMRQLVRVEHGRLLLERCRLQAPMQVEPDGGDLIVFRTDGSRLLDEPRGGDRRALCRLVDCVLITGGVALRLDAGAVIAQLDECALATGSAAIVLAPQNVARHRFLADLQLSRCTFLPAGDLIRCEPWPGAAEGPDRPWLISSHACVLLDAFDRAGAPSTTVLLRAHPDALSRRAVLWQSWQDAYGVTRFVAAVGSDAPPPSFPDLKRDWAAFWGDRHVVDPREAKSLVALPRGRIAPAKLKPEDLALVPAAAANAHLGQPLPVGADPARLGLKAAATKR
jgi:serine/threonine-protein kinase